MSVFGLRALVRRSKDYIYCKFRGFHFVSIFFFLTSFFSFVYALYCRMLFFQERAATAASMAGEGCCRCLQDFRRLHQR